MARALRTLAALCVLSACGKQEPACADFDPLKNGWLQDHDRTGEVTLRSEPSQSGDVRAVVSFEGLPRGESLAARVMRQCKEPDAIQYYFVVLDNGRSGWVDEKYFYWNKPQDRPAPAVTR